MVIKAGNQIEIIGLGAVILVTGSSIKHANVLKADSGQRLSVENLKVHVLNRKDGYLIGEEKFVPLVVPHFIHR